jgi:UDP-2,3-diacylglucosamine pyrophosphatase LpxH
MPKFDIISDIHCDLWVKQNQTVDKFKRFIEMHIKPKSDYIIIAGDLAHDRKHGLMFIEAFKKFYKRIVFVFGNHDYYMTFKEQEIYSNFREKIAVYKNELCSMGVDVLDGTYTIIDGVKIFGCAGWYDFSYIDKFWKNIPDYEIGRLWSHTMNDANWIKGLRGDTHLESFDNVRALFMSEQEKFYRFDDYIDSDIIVSHVSPVNEPMYIPEEYRYDKGTAFFCYDGIDVVKNTIAKYWIFGHTHKVIDFELFDTKMICNPLGYRHEKNKNGVKVIEI